MMEAESTPPKKGNLLGVARPRLTEILAEMGQPSYRAKQILQWIHQKGVLDFERMSNIPRDLLTKLEERFDLKVTPTEHKWVAKDGVVKRLLPTESANSVQMVESVLIPEGPRRTLCVSSQAGCALNCAFCETGRQGFSHNLTAAEIISQVWLARFDSDDPLPMENRVSNVVFMGMGEPLLNLAHVSEAAALMLDDCAYGLSKRKVTLSTAGVVPGIQQLDRTLELSLAISLHAPNDDLRNQLVPINSSYDLDTLLTATKQYLADLPGKRHATIEYILLDGINDSLDCADALFKVLKGLRYKINLIPYNPVPGLPFGTPNEAKCDAFRLRLLNHGARVTTRKPRGQDISAACGQLAGVLVGQRQVRQFDPQKEKAQQVQLIGM